MGSGASDLRNVSPTTLKAEINDEIEKASVAHANAIKSVFAKEGHRTELEKIFKTLQEKHALYLEAFKEEKTKDELYGLATLVNDSYNHYINMRNMYVYEIGDIVKVKDPTVNVFVEGLIVNMSDNIIDVQLEPEGESTMDPMNEEDPVGDSVVRVNIQEGEVRKVRSWSMLEIGDRVRVREGSLYFQGIVEDTSQDQSEVTVRFGTEDDVHQMDDDIEIETEETQTVVCHRCMCEKIDTARIARLRFRDSVRRVQKSIFIANAFKEGIQGGSNKDLLKMIADETTAAQTEESAT